MTAATLCRPSSRPVPLSASPELEAYVRGAVEAARADPALQPPCPVPSPSTPGDTPTPGAVRSRTPYRTGRCERVALSPPTDHGRARALVDPVTIDEQWQTAVETALQAWATTYAPQLRTRSSTRSRRRSGRTAGVRGPHRRPAPDVVAGITQIMLTVAQQAQVGRSREAVGQGVDLPGPPDLPVIDLQAFAGSMLQLLVKSMVTTASRKAIAAYAAPGATGTTWRRGSRELSTLTLAQPRDTFGAIMSYGQGQGPLERPRDRAGGHVRRVRIMDANMRAVRRHRRHRVPVPGAADAAYASGGYSECAGGLRCRGIVVTTWD